MQAGGDSDTLQIFVVIDTGAMFGLDVKPSDTIRVGVTASVFSRIYALALWLCCRSCD